MFKIKEKYQIYGHKKTDIYKNKNLTSKIKIQYTKINIFNNCMHSFINNNNNNCKSKGLNIASALNCDINYFVILTFVLNNDVENYQQIPGDDLQTPKSRMVWTKHESDRKMEKHKQLLSKFDKLPMSL